MSFNRRRVALACTFCRHRKRRCDAGRPSCRGCLESEVECQYDETPVKRIDSSGGSREIIGRLQDIEAMLQDHMSTVHSLSSRIDAAVSQTAMAASAMAAASSPSGQTQVSVPASTLEMAHILSHDLAAGLGSTPGTALASGLGPGPPPPPLGIRMAFDVQSSELPPLTIPAGHKTSSNYLLRLPAMKQLIGEYPDDLFFLLESRNPMPSSLSLSSMSGDSLLPAPGDFDRELLDCLVAAFYAHAYPCHPLLDRADFDLFYQAFLESPPRPWTIETALCLIVFAIGSVIVAPPGADDFQTAPPGMAYMGAALPTLMAMSSWSFHYPLLLPQALVLASLYFAYIVRPLQSWRLVYSASSLLQFKLCRLSNREDDDATRESILRIFWSCFLIECDRLAELELPQSGFQQLIDQTSLPAFTTVDSSLSTAYLAEISIRRLLNRVHNSLYPRMSATTLSASEDFSAEEIVSVSSVCDELYRQLNAWYESIPDIIRPPLDPNTTDDNDRQTILRIRYFAARHIIHRPFVLYMVTHNDHALTAATPQTIIDKADLCLESCRTYLHNTTRILQKQSLYTWTFSLSSLGCLVVLTLASRCPALAPFVQDIDDLQTLAINNVKPWAYRGSSLETVLSTMQEMQRKQRLLSCI